jgi:zinc transporter 1/2/3
MIILQGLAAGTLLYVVFFEIFAEEGKKIQRKFYHILMAIVGFVLMACLEFIGNLMG